MTEQPRRSRSTEAFFGRRKGKHIRESQIEAIEALMPVIGLDLSKTAPDPVTDLWPGKVNSLRMEIGFGAGEHILHRAANEPQTGFIGVEPFITSMGKMLMELREKELGNIRVYDDDATRVLDWLPDSCLDRIDLLYPDPWPKRKHWKRRFVGPATIERFARVLRKGGVFCFASDIDTYINWTLRHFMSDGRFLWAANKAADWREPWQGWPGTRYEGKAFREGRTPAYLTFRRL